MTEDEKQRLALYIDAVKLLNAGRYDRASKLANKILGRTRDDIFGLIIKIIAHIFSGEFPEAMQIFERYPTVTKKLEFEHLYCLYRTKKSNNALEILKTIESPSNSEMELKAQILYRLEFYEELPSCYEFLIKEMDDDYGNERQVNLGASACYLTDKKILHEVFLKEETYEMAFNKAIMLIKKEKFKPAIQMIELSEKLLRESFEEDGATEEEIIGEMIYIRALLAYAYQRQGRTKEAIQIYQEVYKQKCEDAALLAIISNNSVVLNKEQNIFDSTKKLKIATSDSLVDKLPSELRKVIAYNNAVFKSYQHKYEASNKCCDSAEKTWPDMTKNTTILRAFNNYKLDSKSNPLDLIDLNSETTDADLPLKLTCVQLLLAEGRKLEACKVLESLGEFRYKAGILGALITLYLNLGKQDVALQVYKDAVEWYKANKASNIEFINLFKQSAEFHMRNSRPEVAADSLEQVLVVKNDDMKAYCELILAYSQFNEEKAVQMSSSLDSLSEIYKEIDLDTLESTHWLTTKKSSTNTASNTASPKSSSESVVVKRKHKKRKGKLPKNYNASTLPDSERWLPKHERTGFRKRRERKMKDIIKGSQGLSIGQQSEQYDFTRYVVESEDSPTSVTPSPMQKNRPKKANPKKKNKRR